MQMFRYYFFGVQRLGHDGYHAALLMPPGKNPKQARLFILDRLIAVRVDRSTLRKAADLPFDPKRVRRNIRKWAKVKERCGVEFHIKATREVLELLGEENGSRVLPTSPPTTPAIEKTWRKQDRELAEKAREFTKYRSLAVERRVAEPTGQLAFQL